MAANQLEVTNFKGLRNDKGQKFIPPTNFFAIQNFNFDDLIGANKILAPSIISNQNSTTTENGLSEFKFLDANNVLQTISVEVRGGSVYKNWNTGSPTLLYSGLQDSKARFTVQNDRLFIVNGKDYPLVFDGTTIWQMGAPTASTTNIAGNPNGTYYYALTYVTAAGEECLGTISNTVTVINNKISLDIPIGYAGTLNRKLYRIKNGGNILYFVATIADNSTQTYIDDIGDASLGAPIIAINNECPKPYFIETSFSKLVGAKSDKFPTQLNVGGVNLEVWDAAAFVDISDYGNDFSAVQGMAQDYSMLIVNSEREIFTVDVTGSTTVVSPTRANVGCKNGYTMVRVPANGSFAGGVMFLSSLNDIRLFNGNFAQPVATSLDNLTTDNQSQEIRQTLEYQITPSSKMDAIFYDYKYHLIIDNLIVIFDIRTQAWSTYQIKTDSYSPNYNVLGIFNGKLYAGQRGASIIEQFYAATTYRSEDYSAFLQSPQMLASDEVKYFKDLRIYFVSSSQNSLTITVTIDGQSQNAISETLELDGGAFDENFFSSDDFQTDENNEDYRVFHINRWGRWIEFKIESPAGVIFYRGFKLTWDGVKNEE